MSPYATNLDHLQAELHCLNVRLAQAVQQLRAQRDNDLPAEVQGWYISETAIDRLVHDSTSAAAPETDDLTDKIAYLQATIRQQIAASEVAGVPLRLPHLAQVFDLTPFETQVLLLALAPEVDQRYQTLYAYLQDHVEQRRPTVALALRLLCPDPAEPLQARLALEDNGRLRAIPLLQMGAGLDDRPVPLLNRELWLDDRLVAFLLGSDCLDGRLTQPLQYIQWVDPQVELADLVVPKRVRIALHQLVDAGSTAWLCLLQGEPGAGKQTCGEAVCQALGCSLLRVDLAALIQTGAALNQWLPLIWREAQLYGCALYLDGWEHLIGTAPHQRWAIAWIEQAMERFPRPVFVGSQQPWQPTRSLPGGFIAIALPRPDSLTRQHLWALQLQGLPEHPKVNLNDLANQYRFSPGQIRQAVEYGRHQAHWRGQDSLTQADLVAGCQQVCDRTLIRFAQKLVTRRTWADLVLPKDTLAQLQEFGQHVRHRHQVYEQWGFKAKLGLSQGLVALFTGESGTGKTLSAEVLATELGLDLYRIDLASVVSKYIGETEKNLSQVFQDAQASHAILFFDEADALFGKRSAIKDAHDRYANIEVNYLLQQVESYDGVIILASNLSKNIDPAFLRRLNLSIAFPFPDEGLRLRLWRTLFPPQAPVAKDVDLEFLARQFKLPGGNIKNVVVSAAFQAAEADQAITMEHLIRAMRREYQKLDRLCEKSHFGPYYDWIRE